MTDQRQDTESPFATLEPPDPPKNLRDRALRRAVAALDRPPRQDVWARVYSNRPLRAAWAAAILVLVLANVLLPSAHQRSGEDEFVGEAARRIPELREVVAVPRLREAYVSIDGLSDRTSVVPVPARPGSRRKEKTS